jgi:hypothetical protein
MLVAIAAAVAVPAVMLTTTGRGTTHRQPSTPTVYDTGPAYAWPHVRATIKPTPSSRADKITANNQNSSAYTKAELYNAAR